MRAPRGTLHKPQRPQVLYRQSLQEWAASVFSGAALRALRASEILGEPSCQVTREELQRSKGDP